MTAILHKPHHGTRGEKARRPGRQRQKAKQCPKCEQMTGKVKHRVLHNGTLIRETYCAACGYFTRVGVGFGATEPAHALIRRHLGQRVSLADNSRAIGSRSTATAEGREKAAMNKAQQLMGFDHKRRLERRLEARALRAELGKQGYKQLWRERRAQQGSPL